MSFSCVHGKKCYVLFYGNLIFSKCTRGMYRVFAMDPKKNGEIYTKLTGSINQPLFVIITVILRNNLTPGYVRSIMYYVK